MVPTMSLIAIILNTVVIFAVASPGAPRDPPHRSWNTLYVSGVVIRARR
jgi:hypothetical protein